MSHVDDGELTAYADGAYPANDPVALRIAAHLSTCGNCRTRLEQSHELRDRAAEILAFATPATMVAPSFEALQAQAATLTRAPRRAIPLAWAASIILALGLGWFSRDMVRSPMAMRSDMVVQQDERAPTVEMNQEAAPPSIQPTAPPVTGQASRARGQEGARDLAANRVTEEGKTTGAVADAVVAAPQAAATPTPAAAPPPTAPEVSALGERRELANIAVTGVATEYITAAEAERRGMQVPRIPELPIARVGLQGGTMIVEQVLPNETVVTLTVTDEMVLQPLAVSAAKRAASGAARDAAPRPQAQRGEAAAAEAPQRALPNVIVKVGNKSVTITGELQPDSLRALGRKVR